MNWFSMAYKCVLDCGFNSCMLPSESNVQSLIFSLHLNFFTDAEFGRLADDTSVTD